MESFGLGLMLAIIIAIICYAIADNKFKKEVKQIVKEETQSLREKNQKLEKRIEILEGKPPE